MTLLSIELFITCCLSPIVHAQCYTGIERTLFAYLARHREGLLGEGNDGNVCGRSGLEQSPICLTFLMLLRELLPICLTFLVLLVYERKRKTFPNVRAVSNELF
jgi:hypothetical protein